MGNLAALLSEPDEEARHQAWVRRIMVRARIVSSMPIVVGRKRLCRRGPFDDGHDHRHLPGTAPAVFQHRHVPELPAFSSPEIVRLSRCDGGIFWELWRQLLFQARC